MTNQASLFSDVSSVVDHWRCFTEFCQYELWTGGPDPHMKAAVALCGGLPRAEQLWRTALYVGVYNVPSAEAIWTEVPHDSRFDITTWLASHWQCIRLRRERRTVKSPARLAAYLQGYRRTMDASGMLAQASADDVWAFAMKLPHVGRYAAIKLMETWRLLGLAHAELTDIRPEGGWSPREALRLLFPSEQHDARHDDAYNIAQAQSLARHVMGHLHSCGIALSWFQLEVLLCEYKESFTTGRQYPGRSLDSELGYEVALRAHWHRDDTGHMRVRPQISPEWALGERQGWNGVRKELGTVLKIHNYVWSDALFDYNATRDLAEPVKRGADAA